MTKPSHLARPRAPKLTTPDNGPGYTLSKRIATPIPDASMWNRLTYDGAELEPYEGRTDANDHMQHGSVVGGKWQPYKAPGLMCVGAAGPVSTGSPSRRFAT